MLAHCENTGPILKFNIPKNLKNTNLQDRSLQGLFPVWINVFSTFFDYLTLCEECSHCSRDEFLGGALDKNLNTSYCVACNGNSVCEDEGILTHIWQHFDEQQTIVEYKVTSSKEFPSRDPVLLELWATNDNNLISWSRLHSTIPDWEGKRGHTLSFDIPVPGAYFYYAVIMGKGPNTNGDKIQVGEIELVDGCISDAHCGDTIVWECSQFSKGTCDLSKKECVTSKEAIKNENNEEVCASFGNRSALAIRVIADDIQTTSSKDEMSGFIFGTDGRIISMSSQFSACSFNQFNIIPFSGQTSTQAQVSDGTIEIHLNQNVIGLPADKIARTVVSKANEIYGNLESQFDFVLVCLPRGTIIGTSIEWKAYAYIYNYLSIYNDENCNYLSVLMHELGHNLGLSHSSDHANYGDTTGMMGISYSVVDGPQKCFNGAKSWQLAWFEDTHKVIDVKTLVKFAYNMYHIYGLSEYAYANRKYNTILKIVNTDDGYDYYITYNTNTKMNQGTSEGENQIVVTKRVAGTFFEDSFVVSYINEHLPVFIYDIEEGFDLLIYREPDFLPFLGQILIFKTNQVCTENAGCNDDNTCTNDFCNENVWIGVKACSYTEKQCSDCGYPVRVKLQTNEYPKSLMWDIRNIKTDRIVRSSGLITSENYLYDESKCLEYGSYIFTVSYSRNDTVAVTKPSFTFFVGDVQLDDGTFSQEGFVESLFIICSSDLDCHDFDGCTVDICSISTGLCSNTEAETIQNCLDCSFLNFSITLDNFPIETAWEISYKNTGESVTVLTGDPYPFDISAAFGLSSGVTQSGRRKAPTKNGRRKAPTRAAMRYGKKYEDRRKLSEAEDLIQETMCFENGYKYFFRITDSFGDGICCWEGNGSYSITSKEQVLKQGGNFSYEDSLVFMPLNCESDVDCNDNDPSTKDVCFLDISICVYYSNPCEVYGKMVHFDIFTGPELLSWQITKNSTLVSKVGPFTDLYGEHELYECYQYGSYEITFYDVWDFVSEYCSSDPVCGYILKVDGEVIATSDQEVSTAVKKRINFGTCLLDSHCNDDDTCTEDRCDKDRNVCLFTPLPCSVCSDNPCDNHSSCIPEPCAYCNQCNVLISLITDTVPQDPTWTLFNNDTNAVVLANPSYFQLFHLYKHVLCIPIGEYSFVINDGHGDGFFACDTGACGYNITLDDSMIKQGQHFGKKEITSISCTAPSSNPSLSSATMPPSTIDNNWIIKFVDFNYNRTTDEIVLSYEISKAISNDQFVSSIYKEDCISRGEDEVVIVQSKSVQDNDSTNLKNASSTIKFNRTNIRSSKYWENTSDSSGIINFCVQSELILGNGSNKSIAFVNTKLRMNVEFDVGFYSEFAITISKEEENKIKHNTVLQVICCVCDEMLSCFDSPYIFQNQNFFICVKPHEDDVYLTQVESLAIYQEGLFRYQPIMNGEADKLTRVTVGKITSIEIRPLANFFDTQTSNVNIIGEVLLGFAQNRLLEENINSRSRRVSFNIPIVLYADKHNMRKSSFFLVFVTIALILVYYKSYHPNDRYFLLDEE